MKNRQIRIIAVLLTTVLAYAGLIGAAAVTAQAADNAPVVQPVTAQTCVDIAVEAELSAADADNDVVLYQLTEKPRLGTAKIEGSTLYYTPGRKAGRDSFHYTAVDAEGNTAQPAAITIEIKKNKTGLTHSDMDGDPAHYAAIYLAQKGVMTGETIGSCAFFHPNRPVTRSEFIAMTAAAADLSVEPTDQTDFADDSGLSAWAKPYISAAAANGLVNGYATVSGVSEIRGEKTITTAEAGVVLDHLLDGTLSGVQYAWSMSDHSPQDWAQPAIARLERASVLTAAQAQNPEHPLDRRTACEMLYRALILLDS